MKELLILNYEKINLKNELIKEKEYLLIFHEMNNLFPKVNHLIL